MPARASVADPAARLIARQALLSQPKQQQKNIDATWQALTSMTQDQANALVINADENVLQGWLDLQHVV
jgi:outer membrane PBP1 activator LpoA protein